MLAFHMDVLKAALADPDTVLKLDLATDWHEVERVLAEFARRKGIKVEYMNEASADNHARVKGACQVLNNSGRNEK